MRRGKPEREDFIGWAYHLDYSLHAYSRMWDGEWWVVVEVRPPVWRHAQPMLVVMWPDSDKTDTPSVHLACMELARHQVDCVIKTGQTEPVPEGSPGVVFDNRGHPPWKHN